MRTNKIERLEKQIRNLKLTIKVQQQELDRAYRAHQLDAARYQDTDIMLAGLASLITHYQTCKRQSTETCV